MFCQKCGKEIPPYAQFCNHCGAPVSQPQETYTAPQQNNTAPQQNYTAPAPKKKNGIGGIIASIVIVAVIGILGYVVGYGLIGGGFINDEPAYEDPIDIEEPSVNIDDFPSNEYYTLFNSRGIAESKSVFIGLEYSGFAMVDEEGLIDKQEFGYSDDIVREMVETIYYPLDGLTEEEIAAFDTGAKELFAEADEKDFINVFYRREASYYVITVALFNLDNPENLRTVNDMEILYVDPGINAISMSITEAELLSMGYIKR